MRVRIGKVAEKGNPQNVHDDLRGGYLPRKPPDECLAAAGQYQRFARTERNAVAKDFRVAQGLQGFQRQIPDAYGASSGQEDDIRRKAVFSCQGSFEGCRQRSEPIRRDAECGDIGNRTEHG